MVPWWERRIDGRVFFAWLGCVVSLAATILILATTLRQWDVSALFLAGFALIFLLSVATLVSLRRHDATVLGRLAERSIAGRRVGDWTRFVASSILSAGGFLSYRTRLDWLLALCFGLVAIGAAWRLVRMPTGNAG